MLVNLGMVKKMARVPLLIKMEQPILVFSKTAKNMGKELLHVGITAHNISVNLETEKNMEWENIHIQTVQPMLVNIRMDYFMVKVS